MLNRGFPNSGKWLSALFALGLLTLASHPAHAAAGDFKACAGKAAEMNLAAQKDFQNRLHKIIVDSKPEFKALAGINRDLQVRLAEDRYAKTAYLLGKHPERIITGAGLMKFSNFDWSAGDDSRFLGENEENRKRQESITDLTKRNNFHADWPRLRGYFRSELAKMTEYKTLMADFTSKQIEVKNQLAACPPLK